MSRIDDLIAEFAPEGVVFKPVGEVTARSTNIKWADAGEDEFLYIDLSSVDRVTRRIGETASVNATDAPSRAQQIVRQGDVIFATTRPAQMRWAVIPSEYDGQIASTGYCVLRPDTSVVLTNYLAHLLGTDAFRRYVEANQVAGNYPSIPDNRVRAYRIPVPPLEVQREIVRVLDQFTQLEAELEAELEARRRQYDHYLNELLGLGSSVRRLPIGEFAVLVRGNGMPKTSFTEVGTPAIHYGQIYTHFGTWADKTKSFVAPATAARLAAVDPGDIVITNTSENLEDVGKAVAWLGDSTAVTGGHATVIKHDQNPKFLAYYFQTREFHAAKRRHATGTKVIDVSARGLAKIEVPLPERAEQNRLVAILDDFDALVNDLTTGLPAEIAARRKQYEYYRDRLLTFEEAES